MGKRIDDEALRNQPRSEGFPPSRLSPERTAFFRDYPLIFNLLTQNGPILWSIAKSRIFSSPNLSPCKSTSEIQMAWDNWNNPKKELPLVSQTWSTSDLPSITAEMLVAFIDYLRIDFVANSLGTTRVPSPDQKSHQPNGRSAAVRPRSTQHNSNDKSSPFQEVSPLPPAQEVISNLDQSQLRKLTIFVWNWCLVRAQAQEAALTEVEASNGTEPEEKQVDPLVSKPEGVSTEEYISLQADLVTAQREVRRLNGELGDTKADLIAAQATIEELRAQAQLEKEEQQDTFTADVLQGQLDEALRQVQALTQKLQEQQNLASAKWWCQLGLIPRHEEILEALFGRRMTPEEAAIQLGYNSEIQLVVEVLRLLKSLSDQNYAAWLRESETTDNTRRQKKRRRKSNA